MPERRHFLERRVVLGQNDGIFWKDASSWTRTTPYSGKTRRSGPKRRTRVCGVCGLFAGIISRYAT